jgi:hypothetical protein
MTSFHQPYLPLLLLTPYVANRVTLNTPKLMELIVFSACLQHYGFGLIGFLHSNSQVFTVTRKPFLHVQATNNRRLALFRHFLITDTVFCAFFKGKFNHDLTHFFLNNGCLFNIGLMATINGIFLKSQRCFNQSKQWS